MSSDIYPQPSAGTLNLPFPTGHAALDDFLGGAVHRRNLPECLHGLIGKRPEHLVASHRAHICDRHIRLDHARIFSPNKANRSRHQLFLVADLYRDPEEIRAEVESLVEAFEFFGDFDAFILPSWRGSLVVIARPGSMAHAAASAALEGLK